MSTAPSPIPETEASSTDNDERPVRSRPTDRQAVIEELERLSSACLLAVNDKDFGYEKTQDRRKFKERMSPDFQARFHDISSDNALSWHETKDRWRAIAEAKPAAQFEIVKISTDLHVNGRAVLYVEVDMTGVGALHQSRMMEMRWKTIGGIWMCHSVVVIAAGPRPGTI